MEIPPLGEATSKATPKGPPSLRQWEIMSLHKVFMRSCQEAFGQDTHLVRKTREEYFRTHCPNFNNENTHDLTDIFLCMTKLPVYLVLPSMRFKKGGQGRTSCSMLIMC